MRRKITDIVVLLLAGLMLVGCASQQELAFKSVEGKSHSAVTPAQRTDQWWGPRHNAVNERLKQGNVDLLFIGDSITHS